ncbi:hypothetical protein C4A75_14660 [Brevibacillus laterosporus]|uniref:DUF262 domain-containing protein n=1 Tax=Brevibacillus laterosporus TaxID=1465 RepID=UPI000CE4EF8F|nr:DUF262 domain-containing protein [Brevibacillus laterosporus]PPA83584.1 hypothetical protein C4A75_14660 [Brevibacillus laterosporus]
MTENKGIILKRDSNSITISEFFENETLKKYNYTPTYQRKGDVWSIEKKAFLIDTILKNYPIPPIFLHSETNLETGKTKYNVIDGKQRLNAIVQFIEDKIYLPENFGDDKYGSEELNGLKFSEIPSGSPFKKNFWTYSIPIEYIDTADLEVINRIFDRLNRNGEPLNNQELRNAKYNDSKLMQLIRELTQLPFWKEQLKDTVTVERMEDEEFISELLFTLLTQTIDAKPETIDALYSEWVIKFKNDNDLYQKIKTAFIDLTNQLESINLDYKSYKINGVSHYYGLWGLVIKCKEQKIPISSLEQSLRNFFTILRNKEPFGNSYIADYKNSMSYSTKSKAQRSKRINSLFKYCTFSTP